MAPAQSTGKNIVFIINLIDDIRSHFYRNYLLYIQWFSAIVLYFYYYAMEMAL